MANTCLTLNMAIEQMSRTVFWYLLCEMSCLFEETPLSYQDQENSSTLIITIQNDAKLNFYSFFSFIIWVCVTKLNQLPLEAIRVGNICFLVPFWQARVTLAHPVTSAAIFSHLYTERVTAGWAVAYEYKTRNAAPLWPDRVLWRLIPRKLKVIFKLQQNRTILSFYPWM